MAVWLLSFPPSPVQPRWRSANCAVSAQQSPVCGTRGKALVSEPRPWTLITTRGMRQCTHTFLVCHLAALRAWSTGVTVQWRGTEKCLDHEACNYFVATLLALL